MKTIGMISDRVRWDEKALIQASSKKDVKLIVIDEKSIFLDATGDLDNIPQADIYLQRAVSTFKGLYITKILESKGYPVVNSYAVSSVCADKLLTTLSLRKAGIPSPRTFIAFDIDAALKVLDELKYPAVIKPVFGSWGRLIAPLRDPQSAKAILESRESMGALYQIYYIQEYVEKTGNRDIRSFVIGDKVITAIYRIAGQGEWRTNTALGGRAEVCPVTPEIEEMSLKAAKAIGEGVYGVDLLETPKGMLVNEVNHTMEYHTTVPLTGVDIPSMLIDYCLEMLK
ncbi:MAG: lysine biosynthesis protein LysX [Candidatus Jordarchaeum sp.]|uniref:lysine biosynthesis protein LysX n=1 Tax=Candidatus Jordarchaeum sp. TaxID=2823881 RepID=UPI00404A943D